MDANLRSKVESNLYPDAKLAVEPWDEFPWHSNAKHCLTYRPNSSQALAIDFFGTLKNASQAERDAILGRLSALWGLPQGGPWRVCLEWQDLNNRLNEKRARTQVDAMAEGGSATILFECKFGEADGGACSQAVPIRRGGHTGKQQCNGCYAVQVNPVNGKSARCALAAKEIRYWEVIPDVFLLNPNADHRPCPFKKGSYQWMRNLVLADEIRRTECRHTAFVIVYAQHPNLPFSNTLASPKWQEFVGSLRSDLVQMHVIPYQELLALARDAVGRDNIKWRELEAWVFEKIRRVGDGVTTQ